MGEGRRDQEALSPPVTKGRQRQTGVVLDQAVRGPEIVDREAHAEDALAAVGGKVGDQAGTVRLQQGEGGVTRAPRPPR